VDAGFAKAITLNAGIGPYSGKELFWLSGWFVSWIILHFALQKKALNIRKWFGVFIGGNARCHLAGLAAHFRSNRERP